MLKTERTSYIVRRIRVRSVSMSKVVVTISVRASPCPPCLSGMKPCTCRLFNVASARNLLMEIVAFVDGERGALSTLVKELPVDSARQLSNSGTC